MYSVVRPMNRSTIAASVRGQPSSARYSASTRTAMRSESTSTPSQSKMTSSNGPSMRSVPEALGQEGQAGRVAVLDPEGVELGRERGRAEVEPELVAAAGVQVDAAQGAELVGVAGGHADRVEGQPALPHLVA